MLGVCWILLGCTCLRGKRWQDSHCFCRVFDGILQRGKSLGNLLPQEHPKQPVCPAYLQGETRVSCRFSHIFPKAQPFFYDSMVYNPNNHSIISMARCRPFDIISILFWIFLGLPTFPVSFGPIFPVSSRTTAVTWPSSPSRRPSSATVPRRKAPTPAAWRRQSCCIRCTRCDWAWLWHWLYIGSVSLCFFGGLTDVDRRFLRNIVTWTSV